MPLQAESLLEMRFVLDSFPSEGFLQDLSRKVLVFIKLNTAVKTAVLKKLTNFPTNQYPTLNNTDDDFTAGLRSGVRRLALFRQSSTVRRHSEEGKARRGNPLLL